uniref:Uncharacterized protein n=1 Tax=Amphilophus citrinellus TaxID=61819 RepID=A0A3Q0TBM7_AMPCI
MKAEIIQRLKGPNFGQIENTNNFHNLYVQRHTNVRHVSITRIYHFIAKLFFTVLEVICLNWFSLVFHSVTCCEFLKMSRMSLHL